MASSIKIISDGTDYFLSGLGKSYNGTSTPWTAQNTSPYEIAMNATTGQHWTPQASVRQEIYGGGPPFRDGQTLIYNSYGNVTEQLVIQMRATSHDNAVVLLRQLRRILNTMLYSVPCILAVQPNGATSPVYYNIYSADVQESPHFINEEAKAAAQGNAVIRAVVTWRRSPFGGRLSTGETLLNAASFTNTGTGTPDNVELYSAGVGDLISDGGQALNIKFVPAFGVTTVVQRIFAASVDSRLYTATPSGAFNTSVTAGTTFGTAPWSSQDVSLLLTKRVTPRVLLRLSSSSANVQLRYQVYFGNGDEAPIFTSVWVSPLGTGASLVDLGPWPVTTMEYRTLGLTTPKITVLLWIRSTDGNNATINLTYSEMIFYYTFAYMSAPFACNGTTDYILFDQFDEQTNIPCLPHPVPRIVGVRASVSGSPNHMMAFRGVLPKFYSGASLYLAWLTSSSYTHTTTATATVTASSATLWRTLRGNS
jgi:hypothetical protein